MTFWHSTQSTLPAWRCWYRNHEGTWTFDDVNAESAEAACEFIRPYGDGRRTAKPEKAERVQ